MQKEIFELSPVVASITQDKDVKTKTPKLPTTTLPPSTSLSFSSLLLSFSALWFFSSTPLPFLGGGCKRQKSGDTVARLSTPLQIERTGLKFGMQRDPEY